MREIMLKRDNTNSPIYFIDGEESLNLSNFENKEILIVKINCVQPFKINKTEGYDYAELIGEAYSWVNNHFKDQYNILDPVPHNNSEYAGTGISSIEFKCTIIKNTIP